MVGTNLLSVDSFEVLRDIRAQLPKEILPVVVVGQCLQCFLVIDLAQQNVTARVEPADKIRLTWGQLPRTRTSRQQALLHVFREKLIQQLCPGAGLVVHRGDECLCLEVQVQTTLSFQQAIALGNKHVQEVIVELCETNLLGAKDARHK